MFYFISKFIIKSRKCVKNSKLAFENKMLFIDFMGHSLRRDHPPAWKLTKILGLGKLGARERKNSDPNQRNNFFLYHTDRFGEFYSKIESKMGQWWPGKLAHCYYRRLEIRWWPLADSGEKKIVGRHLTITNSLPHQALPNQLFNLEAASSIHLDANPDFRWFKNVEKFLILSVFL